MKLQTEKELLVKEKEQKEKLETENEKLRNDIERMRKGSFIFTFLCDDNYIHVVCVTDLELEPILTYVL